MKIAVIGYGGRGRLYTNILKNNTNVNIESDTDYGHGGGDLGMLQTLVDFYDEKGQLTTTISESMQSHYIGFAAEESRRNNGKIVKLH